MTSVSTTATMPIMAQIFGGADRAQVDQRRQQGQVEDHHLGIAERDRQAGEKDLHGRAARALGGFGMRPAGSRHRRTAR